MIELVRAGWLVLAVYLALGLRFALAFQWRGLAELDAGTHGAGWGFRLLITPGLVALWPLLSLRARRARHGDSFLGGQDRPVSPHRLRATQALAWKALAVLGPLIVGAALLTRPGEIQSSKLKVQKEEPKSTPGSGLTR
ncbi:MAG TPA: hypothetical protein VMB21_17565 [Candidatus Limnocylindria bacterium]|jgi:hypothetical protein|nr:hypothetical protein [Candidatus Limnocylindria bacterium]